MQKFMAVDFIPFERLKVPMNLKLLIINGYICFCYLISANKHCSITIFNLYTLISSAAETARQARSGHGFHT